ncbi:hypothetical protein M011DRAFT_392483, partial [Sporormia fimetaria CBS 119925]
AATAAAQTSYFGVMSTRSASPVHLLPLTARGGKFYLGGGPPSSYCPEQETVKPYCPPGTETTLAGGYEWLSLGVVVPGGQRVYIAPDGSMSYTQAHSAYMPPGSIQDGWSRTEGAQFGNLRWTNGLIACPTDVEGQGYQVFGQIEGKEFDGGCLGFNALTVNVTEAGAWQY